MSVSRETQERLEHYHALLAKWQQKINLVSPATLHAAWNRHFADSLQLVNYIPSETKTLYDLGSGAGFPGLVLGICRQDLQVSLIESDTRKCAFLRSVSRETQAENVTVVNIRIEASALPAPDLVTARALAPLADLLEMVRGWAEQNPDMAALFLKGGKSEQEVADASGKFSFSHDTYPSQTDENGAIVLLRDISARV